MRRGAANRHLKSRQKQKMGQKEKNTRSGSRRFCQENKKLENLLQNLQLAQTLKNF